MGRSEYPAEFRRRVVDLIAAGRKVSEVARDLGVSDQTIYNWQRQERIDRGLMPGRSWEEKAELLAARRHIRELKTEVAIHRRATELLAERVDPKAIRGHRSDGRGGTAGPGRLPGAPGVGVRLLRLA